MKKRLEASSEIKYLRDTTELGRFSTRPPIEYQMLWKLTSLDMLPNFCVTKLSHNKKNH